MQLSFSKQELGNIGGTLKGILKNTALLIELRESLAARRIFQGMKLSIEREPKVDEDNSYYFGIGIGEDIAWLGFWTLLQDQNPAKTPIIGHVYENPRSKKLFPMFWKKLPRLRKDKLVISKHPEYGHPIPIPIQEIKGTWMKEQAESIVSYFYRVLLGERFSI